MSSSPTAPELCPPRLRRQLQHRARQLRELAACVDAGIVTDLSPLANSLRREAQLLDEMAAPPAPPEDMETLRPGCLPLQAGPEREPLNRRRRRPFKRR